MHPFEGPEKKVEILFHAHSESLLKEDESFWETVVEKSGAQILSKIENSLCKAFLLSESSLFVFPHKVIMLTCGRTTLINGIVEILKNHKDSKIEALIYERKNENFPELQPSTFDEDIKILNEYLPGVTYKFGNPEDSFVAIYHSGQTYEADPKDVTLEILMHGMGKRAHSAFLEGNASELSKTLLTQLKDLFPDYQFDEHFFPPFSYLIDRSMPTVSYGHYLST